MFTTRWRRRGIYNLPNNCPLRYRRRWKSDHHRRRPVNFDCPRVRFSDNDIASISPITTQLEKDVYDSIQEKNRTCKRTKSYLIGRRVSGRDYSSVRFLRSDIWLVAGQRRQFAATHHPHRSNFANYIKKLWNHHPDSNEIFFLGSQVPRRRSRGDASNR